MSYEFIWEGIRSYRITVGGIVVVGGNQFAGAFAQQVQINASVWNTVFADAAMVRNGIPVNVEVNGVVVVRRRIATR